MRGGSARDLWRWAAPMDKGDLLLTAINTRPKMFVVLETLAAASGATSMTLRIADVELLPRMVSVDAVKRRLGLKRLVVPSLPSDALADELLDAVRSELAEPSPFSDWEGTRRDWSSRDRSSGLQAMALQCSDGSCSGCERPVGAMLDGRGFASLEVHHLDKLACSGGQVETTLDRLTVVCGACHNLLHVQQSPTLQEVRFAWRPACPAGHHSALRFERTDQLVAEDVISLGCLEPPAGHPQWRCAECGTEWGDISTADHSGAEVSGRSAKQTSGSRIRVIIEPRGGLPIEAYVVAQDPRQAIREALEKHDGPATAAAQDQPLAGRRFASGLITITSNNEAG